MNETLLVGEGREMRRVSGDILAKAMQALPARMALRLAFMTQDHHAVRDFVVREMPRQGRPIAVHAIANTLGLDVTKVSAILAELEKKLFFLVRDAEGNVSWAYPVTATVTPHRLEFSTGERTFGAWAEDAFATPFVQGRLRGQKLRVRIDSYCHHCSQALAIEVDEELRWRVITESATPLIFEPDMQWDTFQGTNIIQDYWQQTVFFWSEEHASNYRSSHRQPSGAYLTMDQAAYTERIAQSGLFAFTQDGQLRR